jgi:hypothetical protein
MSRGVFKIIKPGVQKNVSEAEPKELALDSSKNTLKIAYTGHLDLIVEAETFYAHGTAPPAGDNVFHEYTWGNLYEASFSHDLGYPPYYEPGIKTTNLLWSYYNDEFYYAEDGFFVLNFIVDDWLVPNHGPWGVAGSGSVYFACVVDENKIYLRARQSYGVGFYAPATSHTFDAHYYRLYYTIYFNRLDTSYNLL